MLIRSASFELPVYTVFVALAFAPNAFSLTNRRSPAELCFVLRRARSFRGPQRFHFCSVVPRPYDPLLLHTFSFPRLHRSHSAFTRKMPRSATYWAFDGIPGPLSVFSKVCKPRATVSVMGFVRPNFSRGLRATPDRWKIYAIGSQRLGVDGLTFSAPLVEVIQKFCIINPL